MIFTIKIIVTVLFGIAGIAKLLSVKPIKDQFQEFKIPIPMMYLVGILEITGAILLHIESIKLYSTVGLIFLMLGAIVNHIKAKHTIDKSLPSILLLILSSILVYSYI